MSSLLLPYPSLQHPPPPPPDLIQQNRHIKVSVHEGQNGLVLLDEALLDQSFDVLPANLVANMLLVHVANPVATVQLLYLDQGTLFPLLQLLRRAIGLLLLLRL